MKVVVWVALMVSVLLSCGAVWLVSMLAVLATEPVSMSAWVTVWVAVQMVLAVGARLATGQASSGVCASVIVIPVSVTLPVLLTVTV